MSDEQIRRMIVECRGNEQDLFNDIKELLAAQRQSLKDDVMKAVGDKIEDSDSSEAFVNGREYQQFITRQAISTIFEDKDITNTNVGDRDE